MASFYVRLSNLRRAEAELQKAVDKLSQVAEQIEKVDASWVLRGSGSFASVRSKLRASQNSILSLEQRADHLRSAMLDVAAIYEQVENDILNLGLEDVKLRNEIASSVGAIISAEKELQGYYPGGVYSPDPVNLATGNYVLEKRLMAQEGITAFELLLFYNSSNHETGYLGLGWTSNLELTLETVSQGKLVLHGYDASAVPFYQSSDGIYFAGRGNAGTILRTESGWLFLDDEKQFTFTEKGKLSVLSDRNGNGMLLLYDENDRLFGLRSSSGVELRCIWDGGDLSIITDGKEREVRFSHESGLLTEVRDELGNTTVYQYNDRQLLSGIVNGNGVVCLVNEYDKQERVVCQRFPDGGEQKYDYDDENRRVVLTRQNGSQVAYIHDQRFNIVQIEYEDGTEEYEYNEENRRISYRNKRGGATRYGYDAAGNLSKLQNAAGNRIELEYDRSHKPVSLTLDRKTVIQAEYDKNGNPLSYQDADGRQERYEYNDRGQIVRLWQADGSCLSAEYDGRGNITVLINATGGRERFEYDQYNRITAYVDGNGNRTELTYYLDNRIKTVKNAMGFVRAYRYDACGNMTAVEDFDGKLTSVSYNSINKPAAYTDRNGNTTRYEYNLMWDLIRRADPNGAVTAYEYDKQQRLVGITDPSGYRTVCKRDANGNIVERVAASGDVFRIEYDDMDRPVRVVRPDQTALSAKYDAMGRVTEVTDALGGKTLYEYNFNGDLLSETDPTGYRREWSYDKLGNVTELRDGRSVLLRREYYPGGLLKKEILMDGGSMEFVYDANENVVRRTNQDGFWWSYEYDSLNRLIAVHTAEGLLESYEYDAMDNLIRITDGDGNRTEYAYSPSGKVTCMTDPLGNQTFYEYDALDCLISVRQPEFGSAGVQEILAQNRKADSWRILTMERDARGNVIRQRNALSQESRYSYNAENLLCEVIDEDGLSTKFSYDYDGLPRGILYADGRQVAMQYDPLRHLQEFRDAMGVTAFTRDAAGRVRTVSAPQGETISYDYNERGQRTRLRYPDGTEALYRYNEKGQLTEIETKDGIVRYGYYPGGLLREKSLPNGAANLYEYSPEGKLTRQRQHTASGEEIRREAVYNRRGLKSALRTVQGGVESLYEYGYDAAGSLTSVKKDGELLQSFTYDAFGNRLTAWTNGQTTHNRYNSGNQLMESTGPEGTRSFTYDGRGNLVEERLNGQMVRQLAFGPDGMLEKAVSPRGSASYQYNGLRQRVRQISRDPSGALLDDVRLYFDMSAGPAGDLLQRSGREGTQTCLWDSELLGCRDANGFTVCLNDMLGTPVWTEGPDGRRERHYDVFGVNPDQEGGQFCFSAYLSDPIAGTCHAKNREYDPRFGRFLSRDPVIPNVLRPLAMNLYYYCGNDPINRVDPDGRIWIQLAAGIVGAIANVTTSVVSSVVTGEKLYWQDIVGTAAGGFVGGFALTSGLPPVAAGALSAAVETGVSGIAHNLSGSDQATSWGELGLETAKSAVCDAIIGCAFGSLSKTIKIPRVFKIPKVTGQGGWGSVWKQMIKKGRNGTIKNITMKTMFKGLGYETLFNTPIESALEDWGEKALDKLADKVFNFLSEPFGQRDNRGAMCPLAA